MLAQQKEQLGGPRELGRAAEPAGARIEHAGVLANPARQPPVVRHASSGRPPVLLNLPQPLHHAVGRRRQLRARLAPAPGDLGQDLHEPGARPARRRREVGAAVERLQLRGEPDAHRPPPRAGRRLHEGHVHPVHVRPLLAVDLDGHEAAVQDPGDIVVLEGLVLHDVTPVARRVADRQEDGQILRPGAGESLVPPGVPVDGCCRSAGGDTDWVRRQDGSASIRTRALPSADTTPAS